MRIFKFIFLIIPFMVHMHAFAQDGKQDLSDVKNMVESKRFVFIAKSMSPMKGGIRQLTTDYTLKITSDSIISDLPYAGQVTQPLANPSDGGIKFTSTDFEYKLETMKKGVWEISIQVDDVRYGPRIDITVFENGSASVRVNSNDREPISYEGDIRKY